MPSRPWPRSPRKIASTCSACWCRPGRRACPPAGVAAALDLAPNTLTFHFDRLREAGLVTVRREGRSMIYAARFEAMNALLGFLTENCCGGAAETCAPAGCLQARAQARKIKASDKECCSHEAHACSRLGRRYRQRPSASIRRCSPRKPAVVKDDYAKWMLDDPRVNFAISTRGREPGLDHLGIQVEKPDELHEVYARLQQAGGDVIEQGETACCYAKSEKSWIDDPAGISWETFHTTGESISYGDGSGENEARIAHAKACCVPAAAKPRQRAAPPAARRSHDRRCLTTCCSSAPAIRRARSWPKRS